MINNSEFNLSAYAEVVSKMTDEELQAEGRGLRKLVYPKRVSGTGPSSFELRLEICRKEWRRRHSIHRNRLLWLVPCAVRDCVIAAIPSGPPHNR